MQHGNEPGPGLNCNCKFSDAWKCAVNQGLTDRVACDCDCHKLRPGATGRFPEGKLNPTDEGTRGNEMGVTIRSIRSLEKVREACGDLIEALERQDIFMRASFVELGLYRNLLEYEDHIQLVKNVQDSVKKEIKRQKSEVVL